MAKPGFQSKSSSLHAHILPTILNSAGKYTAWECPDLSKGEVPFLLGTERVGSALKTIQLEEFLTNCYLHRAHWH